ncbi:MAG: hypothetical protein EA422_01270 [Gemmatimonadales bacterium]|nr:MAG: hypothetical protein EA422_01270 [Gemmatimonadales bacterium]
MMPAAYLLVTLAVSASALGWPGVDGDPAIHSSRDDSVTTAEAVHTATPGMAGTDTIQPPLLDEPRPRLGEEPEITPGGAFVRSLILPGWGHAATGSHFRGAFYVAAQSGAVWMLSKSLSGHREARRMRDQEIQAVRGSLRAAGVTQPDSLRVLTNQDPRVGAWDDMVDRRSEEVEDWIAATLVLLLLQAVDAFVAGHLMDHPEPLSMDISPGVSGGWEVGLRVDPRRVRIPWR